MNVLLVWHYSTEVPLVWHYSADCAVYVLLSGVISANLVSYQEWCFLLLTRTAIDGTLPCAG
jgi:hypothetical protein